MGKFQKLNIRFLRKNAFSNMCPLLLTTGTGRKSFTSVHNCIPSAIQKHKKLH